MADEKDGGRPEWGGKRWTPGEPLPWAKFDWARWLATPALRRLTPEQRGRFMDVYANTHGTKTPGVMSEEDVRCWAGYSPADWKANRDAFAGVFNTTRQRGKWRLEDVIETWKASITVAKRSHDRARKGGETRARKAKAGNAKGATSSAGAGAQAQPGLDQRLDTQAFGLREIEKPAMPETQTPALGSSGHSPLALDGMGAVSKLLEGALRAGPSADGMGGTERLVEADPCRT